VQAGIERPPAAPWIGELPFPQKTDGWEAQPLALRWIDQSQGLRTGLVRYRRDRLTYGHAVSGELIDVLPL